MLGLLQVCASPTPTPVPVGDQNTTVLTSSQINTFTSYTWYTSTAYCAPDKVMSWDCGADCAANPYFKPVASGGDGAAVQYWFVGYDPTLDTVVVSHQGSVVENVIPVITDIQFALVPLNSSLFPGISDDILVHSGFRDAQARTAKDVLDAVTQAMTEYGCTSVTMVGHSLGGAVALIDSVYLPLWLPNGTSFRTVTYGLPRVGNPAFAYYVDAHARLTHINNQHDPVPVVPFKSIGYAHPNGEIHIEGNYDWAICPGHDNPSRGCIVGADEQSWKTKFADHWGPYNGIMLECPYDPLWDAA
ncbi:Alpha/Beta hydrolase protein [Pisolithus croceorrhizus]|nr:Alpha/Beta hydrolase protein [Pisolithus croceorrhizus]